MRLPSSLIVGNNRYVKAESAPYDFNSLERVIRSRLTAFVGAVFNKTFKPSQLKTQLLVVPLRENSKTYKCAFLSKGSGIVVEVRGRQGGKFSYRVIVPIPGKPGRSSLHRFADFNFAIKSARMHLAKLRKYYLKTA